MNIYPEEVCYKCNHFKVHTHDCLCDIDDIFRLGVVEATVSEVKKTEKGIVYVESSNLKLNSFKIKSNMPRPFVDIKKMRERCPYYLEHVVLNEKSMEG